MNASASPVRRALAVQNLDAFFRQASRHSVERTAQRVASAKAEARTHGREIGVFTVGVIICRPTKKEADAYHHYVNVEQTDWSAVDYMLGMRNITPQTVSQEE